MLNLIVIIAALAQILVALFVYQKKRNNLNNISFALLSMANLAWALINYAYTLNPVSHSALDIIRFVLFFVVIQNTAFFFFARSYPSGKLNISRKLVLTIVWGSLLVAAATISPYVFKSVTIADGQSNPNPGPLIILFALHALITIGLGLSFLIRKSKSTNKLERRQFQFILFASVLNWVVVPITNFVITLAFHTSFFARVSPIYSLAFAAIIAYAIVSQKLFDIRATVARSVGYVFALSTIAFVYGGVFFSINDIFLSGQNHVFQSRVFSVILVAILVLSFPSIKRFFDRQTERLFYRGSYNTQTVLDELGDVVVAEIDLHKILNSTRRVLMNAIKSNYIEFVLIRNEKPYLEPHNRWKAKFDTSKIIEYLKDQHRELLIVEELQSDSHLKSGLTKADVALSLRLKTANQVVGYILFGQKNSGDTYDTKDEKLLLIVANELSITIQNALRFEEIQNFNLTLQYKVENATHQLRNANKRLKILDEAKDDFISMASHQLRTPLVVIKGYLTMLANGDVGKINEKQKDFLERSFVSTQTMVNLVAELLNVSRITSGRFSVELAPVNLADLVEGVVKQLVNMASGKNIELTYKKPKDFPILMLDQDKTQQVVGNFIDNAIHYSKDKNAKINVELTNDDDIVLKVVDNGIGVPENEKKHLFTKFYRADNARDARPDGTGIGLYVAKVIINDQGGDLIFYSKEGMGSTFGFKFKRDKIVDNTKLNQ